MDLASYVQVQHQLFTGEYLLKPKVHAVPPSVSHGIRQPKGPSTRAVVRERGPHAPREGLRYVWPDRGEQAKACSVPSRELPAIIRGKKSDGKEVGGMLLITLFIGNIREPAS